MFSYSGVVECDDDRCVVVEDESLRCHDSVMILLVTY